MLDSYNVIVIGGGAAGMMAAGRAAERGKRVLLLERNRRLGEKLRISGGGRCNILNAEEDPRKLLARYGEAAPFLHSAFSRFGMPEAREFFESHGLPLIVEANDRAFPETERAADAAEVLERYLKDTGVEVRADVRVNNIELKGGRIARVVAGAKEYAADAYVLATGGLSHPETGSTGDGFSWLRALGHSVEDPTPTIVPLKVRERWVRDLAGRTAPGARVAFFMNGKKQFARTGDILFTHFGLSGPTILNAAGMVADLLHEGTVEARIDLFPGMDLGILDRHATSIFDVNKNRLLKNAFREVAPPGFADALISRISGLDPEKKVHSVSRDERRALVESLKQLTLTIDGLMGFDRAVVADGGIPLDEIDTRTMRSKKVANLYLTGDLLNITRPSGGYSLQLCWTTGFLAGENA